MFKVLLCLIAVMSTASYADDTQSTSSQGGLTGFLFLPDSHVLDEGFLRIQGRLEYIDLNNSSDSHLILPLNVSWGLTEKLEVGGEIPLYLNDSSNDTELFGDITAGCAWLYETARGGSSLVFKGLLRFPTGREGRDRGAELEIGAATSTTFRLFRLQAAASYVLNGGEDAFEDDIVDYARFSMGGASYVTEDVQIVGALDGTSLGELGISGSGIVYAFDGFSFFGTVRIGMSGGTDALLSAGLSWTGGGF